MTNPEQPQMAPNKSLQKAWYIATGVAYLFGGLQALQIVHVGPPWLGATVATVAYLATHIVRGLRDSDHDGIPDFADED